jgi:hypothetical protein
VLLIVFCICSIITDVLSRIEKGENCKETCYDILASTVNISITIITASEVTVFIYVVYSQISFTGKQKGRREALRNVVLCGKATIEDV